MAGKWSLVLVFIILKFVYCKALDPPQNLTIVDRGFLGRLEMHWTPTEEHLRMMEQEDCRLKYELHFYDHYTGDWNSYRTPLTSFSAQFDLAQEVNVRVYTYISGACAGGGTAKSQNCAELIKKPDRTGVNGIQDLTCVYYNLEHVICRWKRTPMMPAQALESLYFWHYELAHVQECPRYVISNGYRSGCNFTGTKLPTFLNIVMSVNASSPQRVNALYSSLQIQNFVKLNAVEGVRVEADADGQLSVDWDSPIDSLPLYCVQWEAEERRESPGGKQTQQTIATETPALTLTLGHHESVCLRVRAMLNYRCARKGLWNDWSSPVCYPEKRILASTSDVLSWSVLLIPVVCGAALVLALFVCAVVILRRRRQEEKTETLFSRLFDKFSSRFSKVAQEV